MAALRRGALYKGLLGGSRGWMAVGAVVWGPRLVKKTLGRTEQIVFSEELKPGQALRLEAIRQPTSGERRAARRAR
ncbi:MAG: hypothetical protein M3P52_06860 [Actinomycetota bacterium]|nr:hypothetical protein [Actinomycetota bacterium]